MHITRNLRDVTGQSANRLTQFSDLVKKAVLPVDLAMCIVECKGKDLYFYNEMFQFIIDH